MRLRARAEECPDNSVLVVFASEVVVEDGEKGNGMNAYARGRSTNWLIVGDEEDTRKHDGWR